MKCRDWRYFLPLFVAAMGIVGSGCSGSGDNLPREAISGTMTLDGQPLATGNIHSLRRRVRIPPVRGPRGGVPSRVVGTPSTVRADWFPATTRFP